MQRHEEIRVLFVEDLPTDTELARRALEKAGISLAWERVDTEEAFLEALAGRKPDVVVCDYSMPAFDGLRALALARALDPILPFIILTGALNEDTAVACIKAGANDYVIKERMTRLPFAVLEAIERRDSQREAEASDRRFRESEERYRSIFQDSDAVMLIIDPVDLRVFDANAAATSFYGWPRSTLIGKSMAEINTLGSKGMADRVRDVLSAARRSFHFTHRRADGSTVEIETHSSPVSIAGKTYLFSIIHDISDRLAAERERDALAERMSHYLLTSPAITYCFRIGEGRTTWLWVSANVERLLGWSPAEALAGDWWFDHVHPEDRRAIILGLKDLALEQALTREYRFATKDRRYLWLHDELRIMKTADGGAEVVGTLTDASDRRRAEEELSLKSAALEAAANAVVITDTEGNIRWTNAAFERLTGWTRAEALGRNPRSLVKSDRQDEAFYRRMWETIAAGEVWSGRLVNRRRSGEEYPEDMTITPIVDETGKVAGYVAVKNDATASENARLGLEAMNAEKDVLLREVHHRVKNNMQIITSLIGLSARDTGYEATAGPMAEVVRRIQSMALIHEQFYESEDLARIEFSRAIRRIVDGIREEYPETALRLSVEFATEEVYLDIETAIPAGLIVAELVANAFVHAYPDPAAAGAVRVGMRGWPEGEVEITVGDGGLGLPPGFSLAACESLGMILVSSLARQLHGEVGFSGSPGTTATLRFPLVRQGPGGNAPRVEAAVPATPAAPTLNPAPGPSNPGGS